MCFNSISDDFYAIGSSAVNVEHDIVRGRPFGGTAILYKKNIGRSVATVVRSNDRLTAITLNCPIGKLMLICIYLNTDGDNGFI